jgi:hypothetical protein
MRKAKYTLLSITTLTIVVSSLAFKANKQLNTFYSLRTTMVIGFEVEGCVVPTYVALSVVPAGGFVTRLSSTWNWPTTTCTSRVIAVF